MSRREKVAAAFVAPVDPTLTDSIPEEYRWTPEREAEFEAYMERDPDDLSLEEHRRATLLSATKLYEGQAPKTRKQYARSVRNKLRDLNVPITDQLYRELKDPNVPFMPAFEQLTLEQLRMDGL